MGSLETLLGTALVEARRRIRIVTPYFLPDRHLQMALAVAVLRRVEVEIVIPERTNKRLVDWAVRANLGLLAGASNTVFLAPEPFDHSKLMTVDGAFCLIGSSNWDVRSHRLNFELDLETYDTDLTAKVDRLIDDKIAVARRLDMDALAARPKWQQLRDAGARLFLPYL
jgi:cardiolipin synthase